MKSEAAHNLIRVTANYFRLGLGLALGLIFVPFTLKWIGNDGLGLIILLGAGTGLAGMFREITTRAAVRELSAALHSGDDERFRAVYNSTLVVSTIAAVVAAVIFVAVDLAVPLLKVPTQLVNAARVLIAAQGFFLVISTAFSPTFNMLIVRERFVSYNFWSLAERSSLLLAALLLALVFKVTDVSLALEWWGITCAGMNLVTFVIPVFQLIRDDRRLRPNLTLARRDIVKSVFSTLKWYVVVELASSLHERIGQLIMAFFFTSSVGGIIFGISLQFVSYVRQATQGVTFGLDAVSARMSSGGENRLKVLTHHSTRVHGLVALPVGVMVFVLADPLIRLWIGKRIENPTEMLPAIITTVKIMSLALTCRAISDGWMMILYGAGYIRRYAPLVLAGGIANPVISVLLITLLPLLTSLPASDAIDVPAQRNPLLFVTPSVFCAVFTIVHFFLLPTVGARCLSMRYRDFFLPLWRSVLTTTLCVVELYAMPTFLVMMGVQPRALRMTITVMVFGILYAVLAGVLVLTAEERERFVWSRLRTIARRA